MRQKLPCLVFWTFLSVLFFVQPVLSYDWDEYDLYSGDNENLKIISMDFKNAALGDVLKIFSQQSGMNFISSSEIADNKINLYLENVPVKEALERILTANQLTYELKTGSNIFVVKPLNVPELQLETRIYQLKHATVPSSKINSTLSGFGDEQGSEEGGGSGGESGESGGSGGESDDSKGILGMVKNMLSEKGNMVEDARTNSIIITDISTQFARIELAIARLDARIPQILIEVEMLDISSNTADLIGTKFGDTPVTFSAGEKDGSFPFEEDNIIDDAGGIRTTAYEDAQYRVSTLSFKGLTFLMQFLRTQTDTNNLARPRILTLNNETAEIHIKTDEAIGISANTTSAEGTATSVNEAERVATGVFLTVTPQANTHTGEIMLAIEPKVIQARTGGTFSGQSFKDPEERGTKSILRVQSGHTVVIGGLLRTDISEVKTKVPLLGDVPVVGKVFQHLDKTETKRELIIFITPSIVSEDRAKISYSEREPMMRERSFYNERNESIREDLQREELRDNILKREDATPYYSIGIDKELNH